MTEKTILEPGPRRLYVTPYERELLEPLLKEDRFGARETDLAQALRVGYAMGADAEQIYSDGYDHGFNDGLEENCDCDDE